MKILEQTVISIVAKMRSKEHKTIFCLGSDIELSDRTEANLARLFKVGLLNLCVCTSVEQSNMLKRIGLHQVEQDGFIGSCNSGFYLFQEESQEHTRGLLELFCSSNMLLLGPASNTNKALIRLAEQDSAYDVFSIWILKDEKNSIEVSAIKSAIERRNAVPIRLVEVNIFLEELLQSISAAKDLEAESPQPDNKPIYILSLDGGGIRGAITATILNHLESRLSPKRLIDVFDLFAGTSTGGILALGLVLPNGDSSCEPRHTAAALGGLYGSEGNTIFPKENNRIESKDRTALNLLKPVSIGKLKGLPEIVEGALNKPYSSSGIESVLQKYFPPSVLLSQALKEVLVTAYDVSTRRARIFSSSGARAFPASKQSVDVSEDLPMWKAARATSAAPTYFEPLIVEGGGTLGQIALVDGGLFANNPALWAYAEAKRLFPGRDYVMVSIGTGSSYKKSKAQELKDWKACQWTLPLIGMMFDGSSDSVDRLLKMLLQRQPGKNKRYFRLQVDLGDVSDAIDDASNVNDLTKCAVGALNGSLREKIDELVELLDS